MIISTTETEIKSRVNEVKCDYCSTQYIEPAYSDDRPHFYSCHICNRDLCPKHRWTIDMYNHNNDNSSHYPSLMNPGFWYCLPCIRQELSKLKES